MFSSGRLAAGVRQQRQDHPGVGCQNVGNPCSVTTSVSACPVLRRRPPHRLGQRRQDRAVVGCCDRSPDRATAARSRPRGVTAVPHQRGPAAVDRQRRTGQSPCGCGTREPSARSATAERRRNWHGRMDREGGQDRGPAPNPGLSRCSPTTRCAPSVNRSDRKTMTWLDFSPDGRILATGDTDGTVQLWDSSTGKRLGEPMKGDAAVIVIAFSRDGHDACRRLFGWHTAPLGHRQLPAGRRSHAAGFHGGHRGIQSRRAARSRPAASMAASDSGIPATEPLALCSKVTTRQ